MCCWVVEMGALANAEVGLEMYEVRERKNKVIRLIPQEGSTMMV
jgi:hypothetical protein